MVMKDDNWCQNLPNLLMCLALVYKLGWLQDSSKSKTWAFAEIESFARKLDYLYS